MSVYAGSAISRKPREAELAKFQNTDIKVCLLEPKIGARGL